MKSTRITTGLTVVIPTTGARASLADSIASAKGALAHLPCLTQVIVVQDSTVLNLSRRIARSADRALCTGERVGVAGARNLGASVTETSHVLFLDDDDTLFTEAFHGLDLKGDWDINIGRAILRHARYPLVPDIDWPHNHEQLLLLTAANQFVIHSAVLRRETVQYTPFNTRLPALEDWEFFLRCRKANYTFAFQDVDRAVYTWGSTMVAMLSNEPLRDMSALVRRIRREHTSPHERSLVREAIRAFSQFEASKNTQDLRLPDYCQLIRNMSCSPSDTKA